MRKILSLLVATIFLLSPLGLTVYADDSSDHTEAELSADAQLSVGETETSVQTEISAENIAAEHYGFAPPEDFDPRKMIVGRLFDRAQKTAPEQFNPREFMELCPDAEAVADLAISRMKDLGVLDHTDFCEEIDKHAAKCEAENNGFSCDKIRDGNFQTDRGVPLSCPASREDIVNWCIERNEHQAEKFQEHLDAMAERHVQFCEQRWEGQQRVCKQQEEFDARTDAFREEAEKRADEFRQRTEDRRQEFDEQDHDDSTTTETKEGSSDISEKSQHTNDFERRQETRTRADFEDGEFRTRTEIRERFTVDGKEVSRDEFRQKTRLQFSCDTTKDEFIADCKSEFKSHQEDFKERAKAQCEQQADHMLNGFERMCEQREENYNRCLEHQNNACQYANRASEACNSLTESEIREYMVKQAAFMCKQKDKFAGEGKEFKHIRGAPDAKKALERLAKARSKAPEAAKAIIDGESEGVLEITDELEDLEETEDSKGVGYKFRKFIGLAAQQEKEESDKIKSAAERLQRTIENLERVAEQVGNEEAKAAILTQVADLKEKQKELANLAEEKRKRARGLFGGVSDDDNSDE